MAASIKPTAETLVLVGEYTEQKKFFPRKSVTCFGSVSSISASTSTAFNGSQSTVPPANGAQRSNNQSENALMQEAYSVFSSSSAQ